MQAAEAEGDMLRGGDRIVDWIVDGPLGEGTMGAVYRVHSALSGRVEAALKVMKPSGQTDARALFIREAEALSALRHPAIVHVMGFYEDLARGLLCLVMELAQGETLRHRLARGAMALPEALRTFVPLASALDHAHGHGIFHRDLKPANVVLCTDGPRLVDFGIAAVTHQPALITESQRGTLAYLPPEVFRGDYAGPAAMDVYAFGLLLYEALTGARAFAADPGLGPGEAPRIIGALKLRQGPFDPGQRFPPALREAVRSATDPAPARRPPVRDLRASLESLLERRGAVAVARDGTLHGGTAAEAPADATIYVPDPRRLRAGRRRLGIAVLVVVLVALAAAIAGGVLGWPGRPWVSAFEQTGGARSATLEEIGPGEGHTE
jgi:eukaryotic-like serine/threonine-protein kinase